MKFSIVIPARDEESHIDRCLDAIDKAHEFHPSDVETIVVLNRCTDNTEQLALAHGAHIERNDAKNLASIRNTGARAASGEVLITVDADSTVSPNMLAEIEKALSSGQYIGGGVPILPERTSPGIMCSGLLLFICLLPYRISAGLFWCFRKDFEAIGGFDESLAAAEDVDFALRLKAHGKRQGKRYGTLHKTRLVTSCRKFDKFGDWFVFRMILSKPSLLFGGPRRIPQSFADRFFYDFEH